jgi:hypothetical protein
MNFFGEDPRSAGFGLFNAGGIIMMIIGLPFQKDLPINTGKEMRSSLLCLFQLYLLWHSSFIRQNR